MWKRQGVVCIIPARGGSKGVHRKNIKLLAGRPLIAYAITAAKASKYIDRVIVSTDDVEIARVAEKYGAEVPFLRPKKLAKDTSPTLPAISHALAELKRGGFNPAIHVLVQPTSPFVRAEDIDHAIETLSRTKTDSCVSVCEISERPEWMYSFVKNKLRRYAKTKKPMPRQKMAKLYRTNGAVYATRIQALPKGIIAKNSSAIIMPKGRSVDIDNIIDFKFAESLMNI